MKLHTMFFAKIFLLLNVALSIYLCGIAIHAFKTHNDYKKYRNEIPGRLEAEFKVGFKAGVRSLAIRVSSECFVKPNVITEPTISFRFKDGVEGLIFMPGGD